jgi:histidyl-tRNA synthetase
MYAFQDKGGRDVCLIPEATTVIQEKYNASWSKSWPKPVRVFYLQRCYRYDRPQRGRYREFTQVGVELLGGDRAIGLAPALLSREGSLPDWPEGRNCNCLGHLLCSGADPLNSDLDP